MGGVIETEQERIQSRMRLFDALTPKERPSARAKRAKRRLGLSI